MGNENTINQEVSFQDLLSMVELFPEKELEKFIIHLQDLYYAKKESNQSGHQLAKHILIFLDAVRKSVSSILEFEIEYPFIYIDFPHFHKEYVEFCGYKNIKALSNVALRKIFKEDCLLCKEFIKKRISGNSKNCIKLEICYLPDHVNFLEQLGTIDDKRATETLDKFKARVEKVYQEMGITDTS